MYIIYYRKISQVLCYKGFRNIIHIKDIEILQTIFLPYTLLRYTYYLNGILIQQRTPMGCFCRRNDTSFIHSIRCLMFRKAFYFVCKRMFLTFSGKYNQYSTVLLNISLSIDYNEQQKFSITHKYVLFESAQASVINLHFSKSNVI